jgi:hypothetical protein
MKLGSFLTIIFLVFALYLTSLAEVWQREAPDSTGTYKGEYCSLAIDSEDNPHIAYYDEDFKDLRYAFYRNGVWSVEIVDSIGDAGSECSIALDSHDRPHISYQQQYLDYYWSLKYATLTDTGWAKTMIATSHDSSWAEIGEYNSIAINNDDYPCISYTQKYPNHIAYTFKDVNGWHFLDVGEVYQSYYTKLRLENNEIPIIGYHRLGTQNEDILEIAILNPADSRWNVITLPDTVNRIDYGHMVGFDIDSQNNAYYAYLNADDDLQLAVYDGQNWNIETILIYPYFGGRPAFSLKMDHSDRPCLVTFQGEIYFYRKINGQWESSMVDDGVSPGWYCSMAFDSDDYPRIAAYARTLNYTRDALFYYRYWPGDPLITLIEPFHNFGTVWTQSYSDWECPIANQGDAPLYINELEFTSDWPDTAFSVVNTPLPRMILPQESGFITIRFKPYGDEVYFDTLIVFSNDSLNLEVEVSMQGTGTSSGTNGDFTLSLKNVYIDHQHQLIKNDLSLEGASISLSQNNQVMYGPLQTNSDGEATIFDVAVGDYDLVIEKQVSLPGSEAGSTVLDNFGSTTSIEIGPGLNNKTVYFPESLMVEKYNCVYDLTHIDRTSWNYPRTFHYPAEESVRSLLDSWKPNFPQDLEQSIGRLVIAENMTYQMFDPGYSVGKEFMKDIGELMNLVLYSENWGTSIAEVLLDIAWGLITGDWTALLIDILMEVLQEFLQSMLLNLITEGIHQVTAELGDFGEGIVNGAWNVIKDSYSGWSLGGFSQISWNSMAGEIYHALRDPIFQLVYIEELTDDKIVKAKTYSQNFNYNGEFRDGYDNSNYFIAGKRNEIEDAVEACSYLRGTANLFNCTAGVLEVLGNWQPLPFADIIQAISIAMKITAYVEVITALGVSGYELFTLPEYIDDTIEDIYFPEGTPMESPPKMPSVLARSRIKPEIVTYLKNKVVQSISAYDSVLTDIRSKINSGEREEAILKLKDLMIAENNLNNSLRVTSAPIYSVASFAKDSMDEFQSIYDTLKYRYADAGEQRYKNYLYIIFSVTDSSEEMVNVISDHLDKSSNQNHLLSDHLVTTLDTISGLPMPAIVVASTSQQSANGLEKDKTESIEIQLQNVGALTANDVSVKLNVNDALSIQETDSVYIGTLTPGEYSNTFTWTVSQFSSDYSRGVWTAEILSSNAKTYSTSGSFAIEQVQGPATGGKLTNENIYNYPNPFNPDIQITTLRYSLEKSAKVTIKIFDSGGNLVKTVLDGMEQTAGAEQAIIWDGKNGEGTIVANGVYFFVIKTSQDERAVGKIAVLR